MYFQAHDIMVLVMCLKLLKCADHADLMLAKNRKNSKILYESEHSLVVLDESMPCLFISCTDLSEVDEVVSCVNRPVTIALHQKELIPYFKEWNAYLECVNLIYDQELPAIECVYPIRQLSMDDVKQASLLYRKMEYNEYVAHCIERNVCYGAFDGDKLVGMVGEHDEEIMGLLEVHPEYRRRQIGLSLLVHMMHVQHDAGKWIVSQIKTDNTVSFQLHEKLGFQKGKETITWLRVRKRTL